MSAGLLVRRALATALLALGVILPAAASAQDQPRSLAREDIFLYGAGLRVEPARQTVPKDIATIVSTLLQAPNSPDLPPFPDDAVVHATLRGPSFATPLELTGRPNTPLNIPPLTVAGLHTVDSIRVVSGGKVLLYGVPESVEIEVIDKLLLTQVTARPLSAAEIREAGLVFDKSSFQAYNFAAAFAIDSGPPINISFPVVLPTLQGAADRSTSVTNLNLIEPPAVRDLATIIPDTLKLQTRIPNLSVVGFTLKAPQLEGQNFFVPPIPGVVVIPGDIGFLNQFFSVMLMVANVAPGGSNLVVKDLQAQIVLPAGADTVVGSADDPLRMASTAAGETPRTQPVHQAGPDGKLGTADDIATLGPGETGNAEYLVEGRREGSHVVEMELTGTLTGLPIGPVTIRGRAAGSVLVRNPKFTLTFTHPEVVNAGEAYTLDVTVTNTSTSPANFVSLNLYDRNISGATLVGDPSRQIESIAPGDAATVSFDLVSKLTGKVTAATLDSDENVAGRFALKTAIGELGVPLSPDSLVLPREANALPSSLRSAALGLLGKAYAVATAPAAALPRDVRRFTKKIVWDRAVEVAEAGFRVTLKEPLADSAAQLLMDFAGSRYAALPAQRAAADLEFSQSDYLGFDELRRRSVRGEAFANEVAKLLAPSFDAAGAAAFHAALASKWSYRPAQLSVMVGAPAGLPIALSLRDPSGRRTGPSATGPAERGIPFSDYLRFTSSDVAHGALALVSTPDPGEYVVRLDRLAGVPDDARFDLSLVVPDGAGGLTHLVFTNLSLGALPAVQLPGSPLSVRFEVYSGSTSSAGPAVAPNSTTPVIDPAPTVMGAVQQAEADALTCEQSVVARPGRIIAVLFSEEVTPAEAQDRLAATAITRFGVDGNAVLSVALQPGRRIAFLALRDPFGPYVPRQVTVRDVADNRGQPMAEVALPIEATVDGHGGVVSGRVLRADGTPAPFANIRFFYEYVCGDAMVTAGITSKSTDDQGRYSLDYVVRGGVTPKIIAIDTENDQFRQLRFTVARDAQRLDVNIVFLGRGTLAGRVLQEDGRTAIPGAAIRVTSLTDQSQYGATSDAEGRFAIAAIPVGSILIEGVSAARAAQTFISESIPFAGATVTRDLVLLDVNTSPIEVKRGRLFGHVLRADGASPVPDVPVVSYYQNRSQAGVRCPPFPDGTEPAECAVAVVRTAVDGAFVFEQLSAGTHRVTAVDQAGLQEGQARIVLPADRSTEFNLLLNGGLGSVRGRVVTSDGAPVPDARVGGGLSLTTVDASGQFLLTDVPVGHRVLVAVSDALGSTGSAAIDIIRAGDEVPVTIVLQSVAAVAGRIVAADGATPVANIKVYLFQECAGGVCVSGEATSDQNGGYRIDKVALGDYSVSAFRSDFSDGNIVSASLNYDRQVFRADIRFRGGAGRVTGTVLDDDGVTPLKAAVSVSGDQLAIAGGRVGIKFQYVQNFQIAQTNFTTGRFALSNVWVGPFTIRAAGQFSPDPVSLESVMPAAGATVDLTLKLQATSQIAGVVFQPDGVTPVGANVIVKYKSDAVKVFCAENQDGDTVCTTIPQGIQEEVVVTNDKGEYWFPVVNAGAFTLTVEDQASGRVAMANGAVRAGQRAELALRLLGLGRITVQVLSSDRVTAIPGAKVEITQLGYPNKALTRFADATGTIVFSGGDGFGEGQFVVAATDVRNGFAGRGSGKVTRDGEDVTTRVFLYNATGTVSGHVFASDGATPVPNAEVVVSNADGPLAFAVTDAAGSYQQDTIPLGAFKVDVFEAATAARGFASGRIDLDRQNVPVDVQLGALGLIKGVVLEAGTQAPLKGWQVSLAQTSPSGLALPPRATTTGVDGGFSFPGASVGTFRLSAFRGGVSGSGQASGSIDRAGQAVDVPIVVPIVREAFGRVQGTVFEPGGAPAANAQVTISHSRGTTPAVAGPDGRFLAEHLPLGRFVVTAKSQSTNNAGSQRGELNFDGATVDVPVTLVGLSTVSGQVVRATGAAAAGVQVVLTGSPATGCDGPCTAFTDGSGNFTFPQVAARTFTVSAQDPVSGQRGAVGDTINPGEVKSVRIALEPAASLRGHVLSANGQPARGMVAELVKGTSHLFAETDVDGIFVFSTVSLGQFDLTIQDPIGPGLARRHLSVSADLDAGDIILDEAPPRVASMTPESSSIQVPRTTPIQVQFSEPVDAGTVSGSTIRLSSAQGAVAAVVALIQGDTVATVTPLAPLRDQTAYSLEVTTSVRDRIGKPMAAAFVGSFVTEDVTAATIVDATPPAGASGVTIYSPIRIKFSEPIDPTRFSGPPIRLVGPGNTVVTGRLDYLFGNTVVVFTPDRPLSEDSAYGVTVAAATDLAGNVQPQATSFQFATTDRTPPAVLGLAAPASVIENDFAAVVASVGAADVAVVDFYINDVFAFAARSAPFTLRLQAIPAFGAPGQQIRIGAVAIDTSGNRGTVPAAAAILVTPDQAPTIRIAQPAGGLSAKTGDRIPVSVEVSDDLGVTQIAYRATTGDTRDAGSLAIQPSVKTRIQAFGFNIPANAVPGSVIQVQATVIDTKGQTVEAAPVSITVLDATPPTVQITGVATGDRVRPGQQVTAIVAAQDLGSIASVGLTASGAATLLQVTVIDPARPSVGAAFTFTVQASARPTDSVLLDAFAIDKAGNRTNAARVILPVSDSTPPTIRLRSANGRNDMVPGRTVDVVADATDEIGVSRIELTGQGAFTLATARQVSPPLPNGSATFTIDVPASVPPGAVLTLQAKAVDISGNVSVPVSLALTAASVADVVLPPSLVIIAGEAASLPVALSAPAPTGGLRIDFVSADGNIVSPLPSLTFAAGEAAKLLTLTGVSGGTASITARIQNVPRASTVVTVRGGIVRGTVLSPQLQPVAGAQVTVTGGGTTVATLTQADGRYFVEGVSGAVTVSVRALDPVTQLLGYGTGTMNRANGYVVVNVALIAAGSMHGQVMTAAGTAVGAGVQVSLFEAADPSAAVTSVFTDGEGRWSFALAAIGNYVLEAADTLGNRGRSGASVPASGVDVNVPITYLGRGAVFGVVRSAAGGVVANASVTLQATSLFGQRPAATISADGNGAFRFDGIFVGSFSVSATDPVSGQGGSAAGSVIADGQQVEANISLSPFANLQGTVFRSDGSTPIGEGAVVTVQYCNFDSRCFFSTQTDSAGHYAFTFLPLGPFTLTVREAATRGLAQVGGQLDVNGQTRTLNVSMLPQGTLAVTVTDANNAVIAGATVSVHTGSAPLVDDLSGTTGLDGRVIIERVLSAQYTISAFANGLAGVSSGTLGAGEVRQVTVKLEPTAAVAGLVFAPDGATPAVGARVDLVAQGPPYSSYSQVVGADGAFRFEGVRLGTYVARAFDAAGRLRAVAAAVVLTTNGQVASRNLTEVGLGIVRGVVLNPDSSSAQGLGVQLRSLNAAFGGFFGAVTGAGGDYEITGVPVGRVVVSTGNAQAGLLGEAAGEIVRDGEEIQLDVLLQSNSVPLGTSLSDANDSYFPIQPDGSVLGGLQNVFYGDFGSRTGGFKLDLTAGGTTVPFTGQSFGTFEDDRQEIAIRQPGVLGLDVTRKVFVPRGGYFARYLERLSNPTAAPITVDVRVTSHLRGYSSSQRVVASSDGNAQMNVSGTDTSDRWVTFDDNTDGDPYWEGTATPVALVFDGSGAPVRALTGGFSNALTAQYAWRVTVPAGGVVTLMHFGAQQTGQAAARATAERLAQLPPEALSGLSPEEIASIQNFAVPADGLSALPPLPGTEGRISGRVLEGDGVTPVGSAQVQFRSGNLFFGRRQFVYSDSSGAFTLQGSVPAHRAVAIEGYTLTAQHPVTSIGSPIVPGTFAAGDTQSVQDVVFTNAAIVRGTVTTFAGAPAGGGTVSLYRGNPYFSRSVNVDGTGAFRFVGVPAGTLTITAQRSVPRGTGISSTPAALTVAGGTVVDVPLVLEPTGTLNVTVLTAAGAAVGQAYVYFYRDDSNVYRDGNTDTSGHLSSLDMPLGHYRIVTSDPVNNVQVLQMFDIAAGVTTNVEMRLVAVGTLQVQVNRANGQPAAANVRIQENQFGFARNVATNAAGAVAFAGVPQSAYTVEASSTATDYNGTGAITGPVAVTVGAGTTPLTLTLPAFGSVTGILRYAGGAPVTNSYYQNIQLIGPGYQGQAYLFSDGHYTFDGVPAGVALTLRGWHPGRYAYGSDAIVAEQSGLIITTDGETLTRDLALPPIVTLRVSVLRADGTPFPGIQIQSKETFRPYFQYRGTASAAGQLDVQGVEGAVTIRALDPNTGIVLQETTIDTTTFTEGALVPVTVQITAISGTVQGHVYAADGVTPIAGAYVQALNAGDRAYMGYRYTDAAGAYRFDDLLPGSAGFIVQAYDPSFLLTVEAAGQFESVGQTKIVDVVLPLVKASVVGSVFAGDGVTPIANASVSVTASGSNIANATTAADGRYALSGLYLPASGAVVRADSPNQSIVASQAFAAPAQNGTVTVNITLPGTLGSISGTVTAGDGVTPLANAEVDATVLFVDPDCSECSGRRTVGYAYTAADGSFSFSGLLAPATGVTLRAWSPGYTLSTERTVNFPQQNAVVSGIVISLPVTSVTGRVTFSNGDPVSALNAFITGTGSSGGTYFPTATRPDGTFSFAELPAGTYRLTAQDIPSGLTAGADFTLTAAQAAVVNVALPASNSVVVRVLGTSDALLAGAQVALVSEGLGFERYATTAADGTATFTRVPVGAFYVQAVWYDGTSNRFASGSGTLAEAGGPLQVDLHVTGGGTVTVTATRADGTVLADTNVRLDGFGSAGPLGYFSSTRVSDASGVAVFADVPAGLVQATAFESGIYGVANGAVNSAPAALPLVLGNARRLSANLSGTDGFLYDVQSSGSLSDGGTTDRRFSDAYDGMYGLRVNTVTFPGVSAAALALSGRQFVLGPQAAGSLLMTRKIYVPAEGGFARYLEIVSNPTGVTQNARVRVEGNLGSDSSTAIIVRPEDTGNTYAVTVENYSGSTDPALAHVFAGAGAVPVPVSTLSFVNGNDRPYYEWQTSVPPNGTAIFMHFAVQRVPTDRDGAGAQATSLVNLTDANALTGLTAEEKAAIRNFIVPQ